MRFVIVAAALAAVVALPSVASAQFPDQSAFQKVTLNDRPGEPMSLAVLPDGRVLHAARTGEIRLHDPRTGTNNIVTDMKAAPQGLYQHDEEGVQGIALDPNFADNRWVYVYYSPKLDTPTDVLGTGINEGDAPENLRDAERPRSGSRSSTATALLSRFKFAEQPARLRDRAGDPARPDVARHLLPRRRPDRLRRRGQPVPVDGRRLEPVPVGGLRAARRSRDPQPGVRLAPHVGQHERPPRQAPADPASARTAATSARRATCSGPGSRQDPSRDLRDGLPQPVPLRGQPGQRARLRRRLLARRPGGGPARGPGGHRPLDARPRRGQLRLAVLHHAGRAVRRLRLHAGRRAVR